MIDLTSYLLGRKSGGGGGSPGGGGGGGGGSTEEWIGDGNTHLWITLPEGRTSPMLGVCPNGTVTVDWGDGTAPDVLTGTNTSTVKWTPNHEYATAGDYVITLTVDGEMGFGGRAASYENAYILRNSPTYDSCNIGYQNSLQRIEFGNGVTNIRDSAFHSCYSLTSIAIPDSVTEIAAQVFRVCRSLENISIPDSVTSIGDYAFADCSSLADINIPNGVRTVGTSAFDGCYSLASVTIPDGVTSIGSNTFRSCYSLRNVYVPDSVNSIGSYAFNHCDSLGSITIPSAVTKIQTRVFQYCYSMKFCDFTKHTAVPTLAATDTFQNIPADCEIRVPAALVDAWKAATNWSTYADYIVGV